MKKFKRKYQDGGAISRESQINQTEEGLVRQQGPEKNFLKDAGKFWLDTALAPIGGVIGQDLYKPEYSE